MKLERTIGRRATRGCLEMSISWNQADSHISSATTKFSPPCCTLTTMQAIQILTTGSADVLTLRDLPTPTPGPGEALIRIEASGVNFIDTYFREGRYPAKLPYTLGQEAAGTIVAVAPDVTTFKPGDRVAWCLIPGTYAQLAVAPAARLVAIPDGVTTQQAAAAILQGMTSHYLLRSTYA